MKFYVISIVIVMFSLITYTYQNLEYKGYERIHGCTGECYAEYVKIHGTPAQIEARKKAAAEGDPFSSIRSLWAGCAACHGNEGQGMAVFPKLAGQNSEYIIDRLTTYKNRGEVGNMSSTMWSQAAMLSEQEIETLGKFIEETMK
jgi:cytochrome c553|tara:strand:- start:358 stop:792 length:435 start_codon:yes stop_codon:yes gene_type:complete